MNPRVVLASRNPKKVLELSRILSGAHAQVDVVGPDAFAQMPEVVESGETFLANATLKAVAVATFTGEIAIADDSGLTVDALKGMPGVLSARWAGGHGDDGQNLALVLAQLRDVPAERRGAAFECAAVAARITLTGDLEILASHGSVRGRLAMEPVGVNGFGYDPIFVPDGHQETTAQLEPAAKDGISHRGQALRGLAEQLTDWLG